MNQPFANKIFVFNERINAQYIIDLYSGDYEMISDTFTDVMNEYPSLLENIQAAYQAKDIQALKKAVHKIKPLFGFTGFTSMESQCQQFETACETASSLQALATEFTLLKNNLLQTRSIIEEEKERLALFNSR
jgi:HPt (histidine-containing phosphotransfer) domain-containing protein